MIDFIMAGYFIVGFVVWCRATAHLAYHMACRHHRPEADDWWLSSIVGLLIALAWPVILVGFLVARTPLLAPPRWARVELREQELREREAEVRRMERELGLDVVK